jgi:hypothetical protein
MKEFSAQTGGRYTYVDDVLNLQDLALAFASIFDGCDNFIVSGCKVSGTSISNGYVYINGKLRYFSGASGRTAWPQYICENNHSESVAYADTVDKVGRNIYSCVIAGQKPSSPDQLTGVVPQYIEITASGGKSLKDALFGRYALLLNAAAGTQDVNGLVNFKNDVAVHGTLSTSSRVVVHAGTTVGLMYYENNVFIVQSKTSSGKAYKMTISDSNGFSFYVDGALSLSLDEKSINCKLPVIASSVRSGNLKTAVDSLFNDGVADDSGTLYLNYMGYNGGNSYYRNTVIGNGKGAPVIAVTGKTASVGISGRLTVAGSNMDALTLKASVPKSNVAMTKVISWVDSDDSQAGYVGYNVNNDRIFRICNTLSDVSITGTDKVDIGPAIAENGVLLSSKYVTKEFFDIKESTFAKANDVYLKENADVRFAILANGFTPFLSYWSNASLRDQIGAISLTDAQLCFPQLSNCLSDMAKSEEKKRTICNNIGAAYKVDTQGKLKDTGWIKTVGNGYNVRIRQVGSMVYINGTVQLYVDRTTLFVFPSGIDLPYDRDAQFNIGYYIDSNNGTCCASFIIVNGSANPNRTFECLKSSRKDLSILVSLAYMV